MSRRSWALRERRAKPPSSSFPHRCHKQKKHHHLLYCHLHIFTNNNFQISLPTSSHLIATRRASTSIPISSSNEPTFTTPDTSIERDEFEKPLSSYKPSISSTPQTLVLSSERKHTNQNLTLNTLPVHTSIAAQFGYWIEILSRTNFVRPKGYAIEEWTKGRKVEEKSRCRKTIKRIPAISYSSKIPLQGRWVRGIGWTLRSYWLSSMIMQVGMKKERQSEMELILLREVIMRVFIQAITNLYDFSTQLSKIFMAEIFKG